MRWWFALLAVGSLTPYPAVACTIINPPSPRQALKTTPVVFRGTVVSSKELPLHPEMRGRRRFAVTLQVREYWKGNLGETATLYDLAPGMDCMGAGLRPGNEYLIFATQDAATDYRPDSDFFWYGWTDVLPAGTLILQPIATLCGELSDPLVRSKMRQFGRGRKPPK